MNEISHFVVAGLFAGTIMVAIAVRIWLDIRDLKSLAAGAPYSRRSHVCDEINVNSQATFTTYAPSIIEYFRARRFRVVATETSVWAISPPYADLPVLVSITAGATLTVRVCDRYLQPIMVNWLKQRFHKRMNHLANDIKGLVEQKN